MMLLETYGQPRDQHRRLRPLRRRDAGHRHRGDPPEVQGVRLLHRRRRVLRPPERPRHHRRLPLGRRLPRRDRRHRPLRLRRPALLRRLLRGLDRGPVPRGRAAAQHRQVHDGRRAQLPHEAEARPHGRRHLDAGHLVRVPAGPDGRRRWPRGPAARRVRPQHAVARDRPGRPADGRLRAHRRHEGHHLGADDQGRAAGRRRRDHGRHGAVRPGLQPLRGVALRPDRRPRPGHRQRQGPARPDAAVRCDRVHQAVVPVAVDRAGRRPLGPAPRAHALLHGAHRQGGPPLRRVGHRPGRRVLHPHADPRHGRRQAGRPGTRSSPPPVARTPRPRCSRCTSAARSSWASSPASPSPRSSRSSPA